MIIIINYNRCNSFESQNLILVMKQNKIIKKIILNIYKFYYFFPDAFDDPVLNATFVTFFLFIKHIIYIKSFFRYFFFLYSQSNPFKLQ